MKRLLRSTAPQSTATIVPATHTRWGQILHVACHLTEFRERLQPAIAERDLQVIRASLATYGTGRVLAVEDAAIATATMLTIKRPWLFDKRWRPAWLRLAGLLDGIDRRKAMIGAASLAGLALVAVGIHFFRSHSYAHWQNVVTPLAAEATLVQQKADIAIRLATGVGIVPLGASVHAEGALLEINKVNIEMHDLIVTSTDPVILRSIYAQHPDAQAVVSHDHDLLRLATHHLQLARIELDKADKVIAFGKKWRDLNPYVALPDGLAPQWTSVATAMGKALGTGDIQKMELADRQLENIRAGAEMVSRADSIVASLSVDDRAVAAPYLATIESVVARGEPDQARAALAALTLMRKQVPLSYSLYLSSIPGEKAFVVKPDTHDASIRHYYLIVHATDTHGAPVSVDIHDTELDKDVDDNRFGIEVNADTFQQVQVQNDKDESLMLVGSKSAGTATTAFALPVLDGRISAW